MDFNTLRMNNIYPAQGTPLLPRSEGSGMGINEIINLISNLSANKDDRDFQHQKELMNLQNGSRSRGIESIGSEVSKPQQPMNVVYKPSMTEFQRATLGLKNEDIDTKRDLGLSRIAQSAEKNKSVTDINQQKIDLNRELGQQKIDISQQRANVYEYKSKHPDHKLIFTKGGNVQAFDPATNKTVDLGIPTGSMTQEDAIKLQAKERMDEINAKGEINSNLQDKRGNQRLNEIGLGITGRQQIQDSKGNKTELPTQTRVRQANAAKELANTRPDLAPFVRINSDGSFSVTPPSSGFFGTSGPTADQFKEINDHIFGSSDKKDTKTPEKKSDTVVNDEKVVVEKDGKQFNLPKSQLEDAKKQGYKVVTPKK